MAVIGDFNTLEVVTERDFGVYLDGGRLGDILLPKRYVPENCKLGDRLKVFIYLDSKDQLIATTLRPKARAGQFAQLKVSAVNYAGAFLDWGLPKELLVPFSEQKIKMQEGQSYLVYIYLDRDTRRLVASSRLDKFLSYEAAQFKQGEPVKLIVADKTDIGYKAIVNGSHWGVIHSNDLYQPLRTGQKLPGFIKKIRPDRRIDLCLEQPGYGKVDGISATILEKLQQAGGHLPFNDKSDPKLITSEFGTSKKSFKMAIGSLYKQRLITIDDEGIRLVRS